MLNNLVGKIVVQVRTYLEMSDDSIYLTMTKRKVKRLLFLLMVVSTLTLYMSVHSGETHGDVKLPTMPDNAEMDRPILVTKDVIVNANTRSLRDEPKPKDVVESDQFRRILRRQQTLRPLRRYDKGGRRRAKHVNHKEEWLKRGAKVLTGSEYFQNRTVRITSLEHAFLVASTPCVKDRPPLLVILCLSKYDHYDTRDVIRRTWASVSKTKSWPQSNVNVADVRIIFILGRKSTDTSENDIATFKAEDKMHGDVIVADFEDSYYNLTRKVLMGLKWVDAFCPGARYVLKVDEDTFLHVGNLVTFLRSLIPPPGGVMIGHVYPHPEVLREGKWGLDKDVYPYPYFPAYVSGNSYVISGDIIHRLVNLSEHLPYVFIEDAGITGILRTGVNASLQQDEGFTFYARPPPKVCDFHRNATIKSATKTDDNLKEKIWKALQLTYSECRRYAREGNNRSVDMRVDRPRRKYRFE